MFTSRAEYRLQLREDNADLRLTPHGRALGLVNDARWTAFSSKQDIVQAERRRLEGLRIHPGSASAGRIAAKTEQPLSRDVTALELLRRPDWDYVSLLNTLELPLCTDAQAREQLEIECKYAGYVARQHDEITRAARWEGTDIPADMDYAAVRGLSTEVLQRLARQRPQTIGLASRIPGVTPAAISLLLIHVKRRGLQQVG